MDSIEYEIKPTSKFSIGLSEIWRYRELLYFFVWRDIKVKYKQTFLGVLWVVFQPLVLMFVFYFFLAGKLKQELGDIDYRLFFLSGFICWNIFSSALSSAGTSMITNASIIKKIYFPRMIIPVSSVLASFLDFVIGFVFYVAILIFLGASINFSMTLLIPVALLLTFFAAFGSGTLLAALNVKYRDFRYILPFFIQALMFISPVFFVHNFESKALQVVFALNPMYAPLELFRTHLNGYSVNETMILISVCSNLFLVVLGIFVFRKTERYFADLA